MKITVYGGTNNKSYNKREIAECEKLGRYLASIKAEVLTGSCRGYPYYVGRAAVEAGARVIGFTPATNKKDHVELFGFPVDGVSELAFAKSKSATPAENLMQRSLDMTPFSDLVIALGGSWGTFTEILFSFWYKKTIILVESFGGAVEAFSQTYDFFGKRDVNPQVHSGPKIIKVKDIDALIKEVDKYASK